MCAKIAVGRVFVGTDLRVATTYSFMLDGGPVAIYGGGRRTRAMAKKKHAKKPVKTRVAKGTKAPARKPVRSIKKSGSKPVSKAKPKPKPAPKATSVTKPEKNFAPPMKAVVPESKLKAKTIEKALPVEEPDLEELDDEISEELELGEDELEEEIADEAIPLDDDDGDVGYLDKDDDLLGTRRDDYDER